MQSYAATEKVYTPRFQLGDKPMNIAGGVLSKDYFDREREHLFKKVWLNVGREHEIPKPGDYLAQDIAVANASVMVVRGKDGVLRAFHNVCAHRCNKVLWNIGDMHELGHASSLRCRFHGWVYSLDGRLVTVPDEHLFFNLEKENNGLTEVKVDTWEGFIFIHLDPSPDQTLREFLGDLYDGLHGYPFAELTQSFEWRLDAKCNWKIMRDAFLEVYHVPFLHGPSVGDGFFSRENPHLHALDIRFHNFHGQFSIYGNPEHKEGPVEAIANKFVPTILKRSDRPMNLGPLMNPTRTDRWAGEIFPIFPNMHLNLYDGVMLYHNYWPIAHDRVVCQIRQVVAPAKTPSARFGQEYNKVMNRDSTLEDINTLELTQAVMASGAKKHVHYQDQEAMVRHSYELVQKFAGPFPEVW